MEFRELAMTRRSIRKFKSTPINREEIVEIIKLATTAPSAGNQQMWHFAVVTNAELKRKMAEVINHTIADAGGKAEMAEIDWQPMIRSTCFFAEAPAVIAVTTALYRSAADRLLVRTGLSEQELDVLRCRPDLQSIGAAVQMLMLAAWEKGYGACYMTAPMIARPELETLLGVQQPNSLAALVAVGEPDIIPMKRARKAVDDVITFFT